MFDTRDHAIAAQLSRLAEAREFADLAAADFGFSGEARYQIKLAMSEAVANAIQHGSADPDDPIVLSASEEGGVLVFRVADTGRFFQRVKPRGELPESGRGLEFMGLLMDEVEVLPSPRGTVLRFAKRR
jgi:serine/threonine-protein kinase RsbW